MQLDESILESDASFQKLIEKYPHLKNTLFLFWGYPGFYQQLSAILLDTRDGSRRGFPQEDLGLFFNVYMLHDKTFPHLVIPVDYTLLDLDRE